MEDVEGERLPLINASTTKSRRNWCWKLKSRYSQTCVTSGPVIICLVWMGIIGSLQFLPMRIILHIKYKSILLVSVSSTLWLFPVYGYLGERWTRYYVIMTATFVASSGCLLLEIVLFLENSIDEIIVSVLVFTGAVVSSCGMGLFSANIIQFSADQLPGASSQQLTSFARWWVFALFFALFVMFWFVNFLLLVLNQNLSRYMYIMLVGLLSIAGIMIGVCFRRKFTIEPPRSVDPVKLIYQVIKYAWKHKYPERPSSFTYTDNNTPSRLDFGKERYGGPFTTDQVESMKSFVRILTVLLPSLFSWYVCISDDYTIQTVFSNDTLSDSLLSSMNANNALLVIVPLLQLIVMPCFPGLIPSILKRMWFGIFLTVLCFIVATVSLKLVSTADFNYFIIVFNIISNVGSALTCFSSLEFIFAQSPCDMQGLLIGIWSIQFNSLLYMYFFKNVLIFYCVTTGLLILSLVTYSVAVYYYKYRVRNELSDINVQARIEEVYERDFRREDQETDNDDSFFLSSVQTLHKCN